MLFVINIAYPLDFRANRFDYYELIKPFLPFLVFIRWNLKEIQYLPSAHENDPICLYLIKVIKALERVKLSKQFKLSTGENLNFRGY